MNKQEEKSLLVFAFIAAFALIMATPALAEKVISSTTTTNVGAPVTNTTSATTAYPDGSTSTNYRTTTTQPTQTVTYTIKSSDEKRLHEYLSSEYKDDGCNTGMYYYDGKCLPEEKLTNVKRSYSIGKALPMNSTLLPLPENILSTMTPAPAGFYYSQLDRDVLLINKNNATVVDAVSYYSM